MDLSGIGKQIREARLQKSWNQDQLAEKTNLSLAYIGMIERGEKIPKLETKEKRDDILEIVDVLLKKDK